MRFSPGLLLLLPLLSPLAHAELIDDVNDRGELRIALEATHPPFNFKEGDKLTGFEVELGEQLAKEMDVRPSFITSRRSSCGWSTAISVPVTLASMSKLRFRKR